MTAEPSTGRMKGHVLTCAIWAAVLLIAQILVSSRLEEGIGGWSSLGVLPFILVAMISAMIDIHAPSDLLFSLIGITVLSLIVVGFTFASEVRSKPQSWIFRLILALMLLAAILSWSAQMPELLVRYPHPLLIGALVSQGIFLIIAFGLYNLATRRRSSALSLASGLVAMTWLLTTMTAPFELFHLD